MFAVGIIVAVALGIAIVIFVSGFIYEQGLTKGIQITKEQQRGTHVQ